MKKKKTKNNVAIEEVIIKYKINRFRVRLLFFFKVLALNFKIIDLNYYFLQQLF